jgi:hypothetical protein
MKANVVAAYNAHAAGRDIPIAVTEHNLFSAWNQDTSAWMTQAVNGLVVADSLGQMIANGYAMANQWLLSGNTQSNGTDYGLLRLDEGMARSPQYYAYVLWSRFGNEMLPVTTTVDAASTLSVYVGRPDATMLTVLAINKSGSPVTATLRIEGLLVSSVAADVARATALSDPSMLFNGVAENALADDLSNAPTLPVDVGPPFNYAFEPYSITLLHVQTNFVPAQFVFLPLVMR